MAVFGMGSMGLHGLHLHHEVLQGELGGRHGPSRAGVRRAAVQGGTVRHLETENTPFFYG